MPAAEYSDCTVSGHTMLEGMHNLGAPGTGRQYSDESGWLGRSFADITLILTQSQRNDNGDSFLKQIVTEHWFWERPLAFHLRQKLRSTR